MRMVRYGVGMSRLMTRDSNDSRKSGNTEIYTRKEKRMTL